MIDLDGREKLIAMLHFPRGDEKRYKQYGTSAIKSDINRYNESREMIDKINNAQDYDNILSLYAHGANNGHSVSLVYDDNNTHTVGAEGLFTYLKDNSELMKSSIEDNSSIVIVLNSCKTGDGSESMGVRLSTYMTGVMVVAPTVNVSPDGSSKTSGKWNVFYKGNVVYEVPSTKSDYSALLKEINEDPQKFIQRYAK